MSYVSDACTCNTVYGIGLPFDHPIWQSLECPVHSPQRSCTVSNCHCCRGQAWTSNEVTFTPPPGMHVEFTWEAS